MWNLFKKKPAPPLQPVEVGRAIVSFELEDGTFHKMVFDGYAIIYDFFGHGDDTPCITDSQERLDHFLKKSQELGVFKLTGDCYVPHCKVRCITKVMEKLTVVPEDRR